MTGKSICAICACRFSPTNGKGGRRSDNLLPILEKLYSLLNREKVSGKSSSHNHVSSDLLVNWVCSKCLEGLKLVVERREEVNGVEERLRDLQLQILRMQREVVKLLGELEGNVEGLKKEMNKMQESINEREGLEELVDKEEGDFEKALQCRANIMKVFRNLTSFENQRRKVGECSRSLITKLRKSGSEISGSECDRGNNDDNDDQWAPENICDDEDDGQDFDPSSEKSTAITNSGNRPRRERKKRVLMEETKDNMVSSDDDDNANGAGGDEFQPEESISRRYKYKNINALLATLNLKEMSFYKQNIITRTLKRCAKERQQREAGIQEEPTLFDDLDPLKVHSLTYDPTTDTLNLAGFQLTINEEINSAECSACGFQCKGWKGHSDDTDRVIYNHILGFHLNLFQCPHCPASPTCLNSFRKHVLGHRNAFVCNICGKPLKGRGILESHKWHHMNEEEKQEAIQSGKKPPPKPWKSKELLQCSTCGKECTSKYNLKLHEKSHQEKDEICPSCGKTFRDLNYHQKFVCYPGKEKGVSKDRVLPLACNICFKKCATKSALMLHKTLKHSDLRPFQCQLCDKAFKTKQMRRNHQRVHSEERQFVCKGGCGAAYKGCSGLRNHEKRCEFLMTRDIAADVKMN